MRMIMRLHPSSRSSDRFESGNWSTGALCSGGSWTRTTFRTGLADLRYFFAGPSLRAG